MPSIAHRLMRRYLPHRVRAAGLELLGRSPAPRRTGRPARPASKKRKPVSKKRVKKAPPAPKPFTGGPLVEVLRRGGPLPEALVAETRELLARGQRGAANAVGCALQTDPDHADIGSLVAGIVAADDEYFALAWSHLRDLPEPLWTRHAAREYARSGIQQDPAEALRRIADLAERAPDFVPAASWLELIGPAFGHGDHALVEKLFTLLDRAVGDGSGVDPALVVNRDWLRPWVAAVPDGATAPRVPEGSVSFALLDYGHPGRQRASANIGDHVQSLAALGHLARQAQLDYDGPADLVELLGRLRGRVRPELQRTVAEGRVQLIQIDRDASAYSAVPPDTWALAFGWYMHAIFESRYGLPFHPNVLPIFVSFHCSKRGLLTDEAVASLRRFGPIGCRDWTTVDLLLSVGVPAFFSGCLTTTVRTVFPDVAPPAADAPVGYVDMPKSSVPAGAPTHRHSSDALRFRTFATNVGDSVDLLDTYRERYRGLVTSRLHCYLPMRSLRVPVDFQPANRSDPRFAGLIDITDAEFDRMQSTIDDRLEQVIDAITHGQEPEAVYRLWQQLNAEDVAAAERRRHADHELPAVSSRILAELPGVRPPSQPTDPGTVAVVIVTPPGDAQESLRVLISSVGEQASVPLEFHLLSRDPDGVDLAAAAAAAGRHRVQVIDTRQLGADLSAAGRQPATADLDRLVVPDLLPTLDRAILLPVDAVVSGDVAELATLDLGSHLLAAADPAGKSRVSGFAVLNTAANRLRAATAASTELRRRAYARHRFDFDAFDTDVLVVDLAAWRDRGLTAGSLPYVEEFGLTYRELLHLIVGPDRTVLPDRWNAVPGRSAVTDPALTHWSEATKPWAADLVPDQERWHAARCRLAASSSAG